MATKPTRKELITELGIQLNIPQGTKLLDYLFKNYGFTPVGNALYLSSGLVYYSKVEHISSKSHMFSKLKCIFTSSEEALDFAIYITLRYILAYNIKSNKEIEVEEAKKADEKKRREARKLPKSVIPRISTNSNESSDLLRTIQSQRRSYRHNLYTSSDMFNYLNTFINTDNRIRHIYRRR